MTSGSTRCMNGFRLRSPARSRLREALTTSVRLVVVPVDPPLVFPTNPPVLPGLGESLPNLGYRLSMTRGRFRVWERPLRQ